MAARLRGWGFASLFLDVDPVDGLPAGSEWEDELYRRLRMADAVVFLGTDASVASRWCAIELAFARAGRTPVFPLWLGGDGHARGLEDRQWIDVGADERAYERLHRDLTDRFDARVGFTWDSRRPPYPGLRSFEREDAAVFFGRDEEIATVLAHLDPGLARGGSVAVVGGSGSGKSSLVRAGVVPRLARAADAWVVIPPFTPGQRPFAALGRVLGVDGRTLEADPGALRDVLEARAVGADGTRRAVLLVIDQAEELVLGAERPAAFIAAVERALDGDARTWLLGTLRSEALGTSLGEGGLGRLFAESILITPLASERLPAVIEGPARKAGLEFAPGLVARMVADTHGGDALPLLAYTLQQLYERGASAAGVISDREYEANGGVEGMLRTRADAVAARLDQAAVIDTLLKLTTLDADGRPARRRVPVTGLDRAVVDAFVDARLLVRDGDTIAVAHEALLRVWPPLADAILAAQARLRVEADVIRAARDWEDAGRDDSYLLRDRRLDTVRAGVTDGLELTGTEREFYAASVAREEQAERGARRRRRALVATLSGVAAVLGAAAVVSFLQYREATEQSRLARSRELSARAVSELATEPLTALRNALAAMRTASTPHAEDALRQALASPLRVDLRPHTGWVGSVGFDASGRRALTTDRAGSARVWDARTGKLLQTIQAYSDTLSDAQLSPDGTRVATVGWRTGIDLWRVADGRRVAHMAERTIDTVRFSSDGRRLFSTGTVRGAPAQLWSVPDGRRLAHYAGGTPTDTFVAAGDMFLVRRGSDEIHAISSRTGERSGRLRVKVGRLSSAAVSSDGERIVTATISDDGPHLAVWSTRSGRRIASRRLDWFDVTVQFDPSGRSVLATNYQGPFRLWEIERDKVRTFGDEVDAIFSPDGRQLVAPGPAARVYDVASGTVLAELRVGTSPADLAGFTPDGRSIITGANDGVGRIWSVRPRALPTDPGLARNVAVSPDGSRFAAVGWTGTLSVRATDDGRVLAAARLPQPDAVEFVPLVAFSADGRRLHVSAGGSVAYIWSPDDGTVRRVHPAQAAGERLLVSPDGRSVATVDEGVAITAAQTRRPPSAGSTAVLSDAVAAYDRDGRQLAAGASDGAVHIWDVASRRIVRRVQSALANIEDVGFSSDGRRLVVSTDDSVARIFDARSGRRLLELRGHTGAVTSASFSADDRFMITASNDDGTARFWDARSGRQLQQVLFAQYSARPAVLPGASFLTVMDGATAVYEIPCDACAPASELVREAERRLGVARTTP